MSEQAITLHRDGVSAALNNKYWEPEDNPFSVVIVDVTHRCNMECANCYLPNRDVPDMDKTRLISAIRRLPNKVIVRLIGGEPTLREDLPEIISEIRSAGHAPVLLTNGLKLARLEYCQLLRKAGLRYVYISMNGADDDAVYRVLDGGAFATAKSRALRNAFATRFVVSTGTIIAKGVNERSLGRQIRFVEQTIKAQGSKRPWPNRLPPVLRFKTIGAIGRYMDGHSSTFSDLASLAAEATGLSRAAIYECAVEGASVNGYVPMEDDEVGSSLVPFESDVGTLLLRLVDWSVDARGVPQPGSPHRGRLTKDFKLTSFFEDIKDNEFGY